MALSRYLTDLTLDVQSSTPAGEVAAVRRGGSSAVRSAYAAQMDRPAVSRAFDVAYEGTPSWETGRPSPSWSA